MLEAEDSSYLGSDLILSPEEQAANTILMASKESELATGFQNSYFPPTQSFFNSKSQIEASKVFEFVKSMPKGAALHTHDISIASVDWVISNITYRDNLFICEESDPPKFGWFANPDISKCTKAWISVMEKRKQMGNTSFDSYLKTLLVINVENPSISYPHINDVWSKFGSSLGVVSELIAYEPVFRDYFYRAIEEFYMDNVQQLEVRTVLPEGVCRSLNNCDPLSQMEIAGVYSSVANTFLTDHADMCGVNMIFAPNRKVTEETVLNYLDMAQKLMQAYPNFFVGFDLVGQEDLGKPLIDFADAIINATNSNPNMKFFFHAGETNWQGQTTDINLIDALLLGSKRIGHGYAITKHPEAMSFARQNDVPMEICPISNQVLGLVDDIRNHPAASLIQDSFPLVISSDDPATWDASGMSYDFYEAFMALAGRSMDLRLLKKLTFSSIDYSSLDVISKRECAELVQNKWEDFIRSFISSNDIEQVKISIN